MDRTDHFPAPTLLNRILTRKGMIIELTVGNCCGIDRAGETISVPLATAEMPSPTRSRITLLVTAFTKTSAPGGNRILLMASCTSLADDVRFAARDRSGGMPFPGLTLYSGKERTANSSTFLSCWNADLCEASYEG